MKALTLGFSPCPNDCFMFDAMIHGKVDTEGLVFNVVMEDVESLNRRAMNTEPDISKMSFYAFSHCAKNYILLNAGSALGFGCGPILVGSSKFVVRSDSALLRTTNYELRTTKVAIPGKYTTANMLFSMAFPEAENKIEMAFSEIEDAVLSGKADAGVIIHENRFTYEKKGLKKILDLGEYWESQTGLPIPLGGIAVKRSLPEETKQKISRVMRRSVEFAFSNPESSLPFVKKHAQEMDEEVMKKHIELYVNEYSIDIGKEGKNAVEVLLENIAGTEDIPGVLFL